MNNLQRIAFCAGGLGLLASLSQGQEAAVFSPTDRDRALAFWGDAGRYGAGIPSDAKQKGLYQVRLTVAGSMWLDRYQKLTPDALVKGGDGVPVAASIAQQQPRVANTTSRSGSRNLRNHQVAPTAFPAGIRQDWDSWIAAKVKADRYNAAVLATSENSDLALGSPALPNPPDAPGPCPADLAATLGDPPCFAEAAPVTEYSVHFDDVDFRFKDHTPCHERYRFYRFDRGVQFFGTPLGKIPKDRLDHLSRMAGIDSATEHVLAAVSGLEGGFDALNTYDTGFVSIGFIQFASLKEGGGSLGGLLLDYKTKHQAEFDRDFRAFGIDVTPTGKLAVLNLETGVELHGPEANSRLIEDKRLTAVFARAGQRSDAYLAEQLAYARETCYPVDDQVTVTLGGQSVSVRIGDIVKSEAGLATLTDLKVNRGGLYGFQATLQAVADDHNASDAKALAKLEAELIRRMQYRKDFTKDLTLSQPGKAGLSTSTETTGDEDVGS